MEWLTLTWDDAKDSTLLQPGHGRQLSAAESSPRSGLSIWCNQKKLDYILSYHVGIQGPLFQTKFQLSYTESLSIISKRGSGAKTAELAVSRGA